MAAPPAADAPVERYHEWSGSLECCSCTGRTTRTAPSTKCGKARPKGDRSANAWNPIGGHRQRAKAVADAERFTDGGPGALVAARQPGRAKAAVAGSVKLGTGIEPHPVIDDHCVRDDLPCQLDEAVTIAAGEDECDVRLISVSGSVSRVLQ
jgi:hypothetical protein